MKKKLFFLTGIMLAGVLAYFTAYNVYTSANYGEKIQEPGMLQKAVSLQKKEEMPEEKSYYLAKIDEDMLLIYEMPEERLYDSIKLSSLQITKNERMRLSEGYLFQSLREVFEFLENSMS